MLSLFCLFGASVPALNGLSLTPPMGWMAWEQFHCVVDCAANPTTCISENLFIDMIDHMAADGWLEAGYQYVNIDDCWEGEGRDSNNELYANKDRFPHGIAWLAQYAHDKGVKLGIYTDYGTLTCGGYTGSEGFLVKDAQTFAKWGVDMLKMDGCNSEVTDMHDAYPAMSYFLNATGKPIIYSCSWPAYEQSMDYSQLPPYCNLWRNWYDIRGDWGSVKGIIDKWGNTPEWVQWAGPGHWNDPDQLVIGMQANSWTKTLTEAESRSQLSIWAITASPFIMSNDLRNISDWAKALLQNKEVIAVDQDPLGTQGTRVTDTTSDAQVWVRPLQNGDFAVALFNRGDTPRDVTVKFSQFTAKTTLAARDLWAHADLGDVTAQYTAAAVPPHDTVFLLFH